MSNIREVKARIQSQVRWADPCNLRDDIKALLADHDRLERERGSGAYSEQDMMRALEILAEYPAGNEGNAHCILDLLADLRDRCAQATGGSSLSTIEIARERIRSLPLLPEKPR